MFLPDNCQCQISSIAQGKAWAHRSRGLIFVRWCRDMKNKFATFILLLVLVAGVMAFVPIDQGNIESEPSMSVELNSTVFLAEMENEVCASRSEIHTTTSIKATKTEADQSEELPTVFLMMLEDGVCASLSPIATTPRTSVQVDDEKVKETESISREEAAQGAEIGVWYVQN